MCETFTNFRKRKAFEKMLIVKSQFARSYSDTDLILSAKKQKETIDSKTDCVNLEKQFVNKNYKPKKAKYATLLNQDKRKLTQFILSNTSNLRLYGNKRYNEYHPFLFVKDQVQKIPNSKIGLLPLPMKSRKKLKTKEDIKTFKEVERSIVMMRRIQYTRKTTETNRRLEKTIDISSIIRIQRWWKLMLKIIKIQRVYKGRCRRKEAKLVCRLSEFITNFDNLLKLKLKKNCIYVLDNYTKNTSVVNHWAFHSKKTLRLSLENSIQIVKLQSAVRAYLKKVNVHKQFQISKYRVKPILPSNLFSKYPKDRRMILSMNTRRIAIHWRKYLKNKTKMKRIGLVPTVITKMHCRYPNISAKAIESKYRAYSSKVELAIGKYSIEDVMRYKISQANYYVTKSDHLLAQMNQSQSNSLRKQQTRKANLDIPDNIGENEHSHDHDIVDPSGNFIEKLNINAKLTDRSIKTGKINDMDMSSKEMIKQLYKFERSVCMITKARLRDNSGSVITIQSHINTLLRHVYQKNKFPIGYVDKCWVTISTQNIMKLVKSLNTLMTKNCFMKKGKRRISLKNEKPRKNSHYSLSNNELEHLILIQKQFRSFYSRINTSSYRTPVKCLSSSLISKENRKDISSSIIILQRGVRMIQRKMQSKTIPKKVQLTISYFSRAHLIEVTHLICNLQRKLKDYLFPGNMNYNQFNSSLLQSNQAFLRKTAMSNIHDTKNAFNPSATKAEGFIHPKSDVCFLSKARIEQNASRIQKVKHVIAKYNDKINTTVKAKAFIKPLGNGISFTKDRNYFKASPFTSPWDNYYPIQMNRSTVCIITKNRMNNFDKKVVLIQLNYKARLNRRPIVKKTKGVYRESTALIDNDMYQLNESRTMISKGDPNRMSYSQTLINLSHSKMNENEKEDQRGDENQGNSIHMTLWSTWHCTKERRVNVIKSVKYLQQHLKKCFEVIQRPIQSSRSLIQKKRINSLKGIQAIHLIQRKVRKSFPLSAYKSSLSSMTNRENRSMNLNSTPRLNDLQSSSMTNRNNNMLKINFTPRYNDLQSLQLIQIDPIHSCFITKIRLENHLHHIINLQRSYLQFNKEQKETITHTVKKRVIPVSFLSKAFSYERILLPKRNLDCSFLSKQVYRSMRPNQSINCIQRTFRANQSKLIFKHKVNLYKASSTIEIDYNAPPKHFLYEIAYLDYSFIEKELKRGIKKPNLMFISLLALFATKNSQEYSFDYLKHKGKVPHFTYPYYISAIERHVKFIKSSQSTDSKVKDVLNDIFPSDNVRNLQEKIAELPKAKMKQLHCVNIYHSIEQDLTNYLNSFCAFDKKLSNPTFINERLKQNRINNTNIFGLTRLMDDEYNNLLNGMYCYRCYFNVSSCHCALQQEEDDLFREDSLDDSPSKGRSNHFEYDSTTCKGVIIKRKPKTEEGYEDPITQMICISDDQLIKKLQIKTTALMPKMRQNETIYENEKEEMKLNRTTDISSIHKEEFGMGDHQEMNSLKQLIKKHSYTHGNSNDKSSYIEFDYNAEEEK